MASVHFSEIVIYVESKNLIGSKLFIIIGSILLGKFPKIKDLFPEFTIE